MKLPLVILIIVLVSLAILFFGKNLFSIQTTNVNPTVTQAPTPSVQPGTEKQTEITVTNPKSNQVIKSPLEVSGNASTGWFFEAVAPMMLVDSNGKTIAKGPIRAQGDWQTTGFVPFTGELSFSKPGTATGQLIIENDNPSGLPENSKQIIIPIKF